MAKYRITFLPLNKTIEVDPADFPLGRAGKSGSLLDIALANDIPIPHACGGVGACCTCHVVVEAGWGNLEGLREAENDQVDQAPGTSLESRLACQAVVQGDVTVTIPDWNRNLVAE